MTPQVPTDDTPEDGGGGAPAPGSITTAHVADGAITSAKLAAAVTTSITNATNAGYSATDSVNNHILDTQDAHSAAAISTNGGPLGNNVQAQLDAIAARKRTFRTTHTFAVQGAVSNVVLPGFFVDLATGQTAKVIGARLRTSAGTAVIQVRQNGTFITGLGGPTATTSSGFFAATNQPAVVSGDKLDISISAATGASDLSVTLVLEHEV